MFVSNFVFVNFNLVDVLKEVLRRVGKVVNVKRYYLYNLSVCEWLNVIMDVLFYFVSRKVIVDVFMCIEYGVEVFK